ncbi:MAG: Hsp70 family protein [Candidatus Hydrogenedentes bacterium]|nr:Hsp70 family protein [Candidatus Hydrogenedentota bacterium]
MTDIFCGIDFGTTNSSAALAMDGKVRVLPLDEANDNATSLPSLLYITDERDYILGRRAANAFIERNVDREVIVKRVDLGIDIEAYVASEPDKSADYRPVQDPSQAPREALRAHATVEVNSPGRLFQSLKSNLRMSSFRSTEVFGVQYQIEELVSIILGRMKEKIDRASGQNVEKAVFGRPVRFSTDPEEDAVAERRLHTAAQLAGFKEIDFFYEPVAACVEYAVQTGKRQRLMVVDIGGGTCDVCVMEFGGSHGVASRLAESKILGVAGVPVAGDALDREIIRDKLFPYFGCRARYGPSNLPMPQFVFNSLLDWQNLYKLNTEEIINWLIATEASTDQPKAIRALRSLIQRNFGYPIVRKVEQAKKLLSTEWEAHLDVRHDAIHIDMVLTRSEFSHLIEATLDQMEASIEEAEKSAGVARDSIDYVLTTGGTCLIPAVRVMLKNRYGEDRLLHRETFTSVAQGLAVVAQYV